jgi:hypothetical protein
VTGCCADARTSPAVKSRAGGAVQQSNGPTGSSGADLRLGPASEQRNGRRKVWVSDPGSLVPTSRDDAGGGRSGDSRRTWTCRPAGGPRGYRFSGGPQRRHSRNVPPVSPVAKTWLSGDKATASMGRVWPISVQRSRPLVESRSLAVVSSSTRHLRWASTSSSVAARHSFTDLSRLPETSMAPSGENARQEA